MNRTLIIYFLFFAGILNAQNLVINPSFENTTRIPKNISEIGFAFPWSSPNFGSPDLFSKKSKKSKIQIPSNISGYQDAYFGDFYAGIYVSQGASLDFNIIEFLQGELIASLEANKIYRISFYYSLADKSKYSETSLGIYMSHKRLYPTDNFPKKYKYDLKTSNRQQLSDTINWIAFSELYKAKGGEKFIIIGKVENEISKKVKRDAADFAYYYIDNVSVTLVDSITEPPVKKENVIINQSVVINNIYFESGSSQLKESSNTVLDSLYKTLDQYNSSKYEIEIAGHTDNVGKEDENLNLSKERAKAVAEYLISQGKEEKQIIYKGYGSSKPIADNESEEGRKTNRRVEFIIKER